MIRIVKKVAICMLPTNTAWKKFPKIFLWSENKILKFDYIIEDLSFD